MNDRYVLDGHNAVPEPDLIKWAMQFEKADRHVAKTETPKGNVSTVFLGLDHSFGSGPPLLFETMVFDGKLDGEQDRYSTWDEAIAGHKRMVERVNTESDNQNA